MTVTNSDILAYCLTNRLHAEDSEYLLQERVETMGRDAVASALTWIWGRFFHAGRTDIFTPWKEEVYDNLVPTDLTNLDTVRARFVADGIDDDLIDMYVMLFDALAQLAVANIWEDAQQSGEGEQAKKEAKQLISAIIGNDAEPLSGGSGTGQADTFGEADAQVEAMSSDDIKTALGGYE